VKSLPQKGGEITEEIARGPSPKSRTRRSSDHDIVGREDERGSNHKFQGPEGGKLSGKGKNFIYIGR